MRVAAYLSGVKKVGEISEGKIGSGCGWLHRGLSKPRGCTHGILAGAVASIKGPRKNNEDSAAVAIKQAEGRYYVLLAVADGVGGQQRGEVASSMAICETLRHFAQVSGVTSHWLRQLFDNVHHYVLRHAGGGATTLSVGLLSLPEGDLWIGNVGDSPIYLALPSGLYDLTPQRDEEEHYITQAVGHNTYRGPHIYYYKLSPGNDVLITAVTDGIDDYIEKTLYSVVTPNVRHYVCSLINAVRSKTRDNATASALYVNLSSVVEATRRIYI